MFFVFTLLIPAVFFGGWFASKSGWWLLFCFLVVVGEVFWLGSKNKIDDMGITESLMLLHSGSAIFGGLIQMMRIAADEE